MKKLEVNQTETDIPIAIEYLDRYRNKPTFSDSPSDDEREF